MSKALMAYRPAWASYVNNTGAAGGGYAVYGKRPQDGGVGHRPGAQGEAVRHKGREVRLPLSYLVHGVARCNHTALTNFIAAHKPTHIFSSPCTALIMSPMNEPHGSKKRVYRKIGGFLFRK